MSQSRRTNLLLSGMDKQIKLNDKLLRKAHNESTIAKYQTVNPNPILGTEREKQIVEVHAKHFVSQSPFLDQIANKYDSLNAFSIDKTTVEGKKIGQQRQYELQEFQHSPIGRQMIKKLNEASMEQITHMPAPETKQLRTINVLRRPSQLQQKHSGNGKYQPKPSPMNASYLSQEEINQYSSKHIQTHKQIIESPHSHSDQDTGGLKEYQKNVNKLNNLMKRESSQNIGEIHAVDVPNQNSLETVHPNGSTFNQSDMTPNITPRLDQDRNMESDNYKDSQVMRSTNYLQSDGGAHFPNVSRRRSNDPQSVTFADSETSRFYQKKTVFQFNDSPFKAQTDFGGGSSLNVVKGSNFKGTVPSQRNPDGSKNDDIDSFLHQVRAGRNFVNLEAYARTQHVVSPTNPIKVTKISTKNLSKQQFNFPSTTQGRTPVIATPAGLQTQHLQPLKPSDADSKEAGGEESRKTCNKNTSNPNIFNSNRDIQDIGKRGDRSDFNGSPIHPSEDQVFYQAFPNNYPGVGSQLFDSQSFSGQKIDDNQFGTGENTLPTNSGDLRYQNEPNFIRNVTCDRGPIGPFVRGDKMYRISDSYTTMMKATNLMDKSQQHFRDINQRSVRNATADRSQTVGTGGQHTNLINLPKIKKVFLSPRLSLAQTRQLTREQAASVSGRQKPRWKTPINNEMNKTMNPNQFNKKYYLFNKRDFQFVNVQIEDDISKTTSGNFKFAQASQYPTHYQVPSDLLMKSGDDRSLFNLHEFKQRLASKIRTPFSIKESKPLQISPESRHKLIDQMHHIKVISLSSQRDDKSTMGKTMRTDGAENETKKTDHSSMKNQKVIEVTIDASQSFDATTPLTQLPPDGAASILLQPNQEQIQTRVASNAENLDNLSEQEQSQEYLQNIKTYNLADHKNTFKRRSGQGIDPASRTEEDGIEEYPECLRESFKNMQVLQEQQNEHHGPSNDDGEQEQEFKRKTDNSSMNLDLQAAMATEHKNITSKVYNYSTALGQSVKSSRRDQAVGQSISKSSKDQYRGGISPFSKTPASKSPMQSKSISKGSTRKIQKATRQESRPQMQQVKQKKEPAKDYKVAKGKKDQQSDNLYINIEKLPGVPLKYELQSQEQIREIQRRIRLKKQSIASKAQERNAEIEKFKHSIKLKQKLQGTADAFDDQYQQYQESVKNAGSELAAVLTTPVNANSHQDVSKRRSLEGLDQYDNHLPEQNKSGFNTDRHSTNNTNKDELISSMIFNNQQKRKTNRQQQKGLKKNNINEQSSEIHADTSIQEDIQQVQIKNLRASATQPVAELSQHGAPQNNTTQNTSGGASNFLKMNQGSFGNIPKASGVSFINRSEKFTKAERQIFNLYKEQVLADLYRVKTDTMNSITQLKHSHSIELDEVNKIRLENQQLKAIVKRYKYFIDNFSKEYDPKKMKRAVAAIQSKEEALADPVHHVSPLGKKCFSPKLDLPTINELYIDAQNALECRINLDTQNMSNEYKFEKNMKILKSQPDSSGEEMDGDDIKSYNIQSPLLHQQFGRKSLWQQSNIYTEKVQKVDMEKIVKFLHQIKNECKQEKALDLVMSLLDQVKVFLQCQRIMFMPLEYYLVKLVTSPNYNTKEKLQYVRSIEYIDDGTPRLLAAIGRNQSDIQDQVIVDSISEHGLKVTVKGNRVAVLVKQQTKKGGSSFIIQAEYDAPAQKKSGKKSPRQQGSNSKMASHAQFSNNLQTSKQSLAKQLTKQSKTGALTGNVSVSGTDQDSQPNAVNNKINRTEAMIVHLIMQSAQLKFEKIANMQKLKDDETVVERTTDMVQTMLQSQTLRGLMRSMNHIFMPYMGFTEVNCMFQDNQIKRLYTITFGEDEEQRAEYAILKSKAKTKEDLEILEGWELMKEADIQEGHRIMFPSQMGITGEVFDNQKVVAINKFEKHRFPAFVNEVDNPKHIKEINNMMIAPFSREDGTPNGLIQLYNNDNPISSYDRKRMKSITNFFGGCIEQLEDKQKKLNTKATILDNLKIDTCVDPAVILNIHSIQQFLGHLTDADGTIRLYENFASLEKDIKKALNEDSKFNDICQNLVCTQDEIPPASGKYIEQLKIPKHHPVKAATPTKPQTAKATHSPTGNADSAKREQAGEQEHDATKEQEQEQ